MSAAESKTSLPAHSSHMKPHGLRTRLGRLPFARQALEAAMARLEYGTVRVLLPDGTEATRSGPYDGPSAELHVHSWRALWRLVTGGGLGFAEGYIAGEWTSPDLPALIELCGRNGQSFAERLEGGKFYRTWNRVLHGLNANSKKGSKRNIEFHYDLGNEFYRQWLDRQMVYSSAIYREGHDLETAQAHKLSRIVELLGVQPGDDVLEVGFGWGALAMQIARQGAGRVKGITLSQEQHALASDLAVQNGLNERIDFCIEDYRDVTGTFDKIVSVEMFEAVGQDYWASYFAMVKARLRQQGTAVLQIITIADDRFEHYARTTDFIQRYIFPGGLLPSQALLQEGFAAAGLKLVEVEHFGLSYARTLADWRVRFLEAWPKIAPLGYTERFRRMWDYYLAYCEGGFRSQAIDVGLYVLKHADA